MSLIVPYILLYILTFGIMMVYKIEVMFNLGFPFLLIASVMLRLHMIRMFKIKSSGPFAECCTVVLCSPCSIAQSSYNLIWENVFLLLTFCFCFVFFYHHPFSVHYFPVYILFYTNFLVSLPLHHFTPLFPTLFFCFFLFSFEFLPLFSSLYISFCPFHSFLVSFFSSLHPLSLLLAPSLSFPHHFPLVFSSFTFTLLLLSSLLKSPLHIPSLFLLFFSSFLLFFLLFPSIPFFFFLLFFSVLSFFLFCFVLYSSVQFYSLPFPLILSSHFIYQWPGMLGDIGEYVMAIWIRRYRITTVIRHETELAKCSALTWWWGSLWCFVKMRWAELN